MSEHGEVIATRSLQNTETGRTVELVLHAPLREVGTGDWRCAVETVEGGNTTTHEGHGVDALQVLVGGLAALRSALKQRGSRNLSWLNQVGVVGLPLLVQELDEDFLTLIESLVSAEYSRQLIERKRQSKAR